MNIFHGRGIKYLKKVAAYFLIPHIVMFTTVVCPVSIVGQWANEVKSKLAANLSIYMYHGSKRQE